MRQGFTATTTEQRVEHNLRHRDTQEWKFAQDYAKYDQKIHRAREKLDKRQARKNARKEWLAKSPNRTAVKHVIESFSAECVVLAVIVFNFALTIYETDLHAGASTQPQWLPFCSRSILIFYVTELCLRVYTLGPTYFAETSNIVDLIVVLIDVACTVVDLVAASKTLGPGILRIFRVLRVIRGVRVMTHCKELYLMLYGLISTLKSLLWAVALIFMLLTCCSIVAVEFVHPINVEVAADGVYEDCTRCSNAFKSVFESNLTFIQQILAGDSWGQITLPIVDKAPWTLAFFVFVLCLLNLGLMNLVLKVIVDQATQARHQNVDETLVEKMSEFRVARDQLTQLCSKLDRDISGTLSSAELMNGYDSNPEFAFYLNIMDVRRDDLPTLFKLLDQDGSGDVTYAEFVEQLHRLKSCDPHTMMVFLNFNVQELAGAIDRIATMMDPSFQCAYPSDQKILGPSELCEKSQRGTECTHASDQPVDMSSKREDDMKDIDAIDQNAGRHAEATISSTCLQRQSSARDCEDDHAEQGVFPPADVNLFHRHRSATPSIAPPQPGPLGQLGAHSLTQPEIKCVQDSMAKATDIIIRDLLAISYERMLELIKHPDFQGLVQGLDTSTWTEDTPADRSVLFDSCRTMKL